MTQYRHTQALPEHNVTFPLQVPPAWHFRFTDPVITNPSSQRKMTSLGNVVSFPAMEPFCGISRRPQSFATRTKQERSVVHLEGIRAVTEISNMLHHICIFDTPWHVVSFPLQVASLRQSLSDDPFRTNPSSQ